MTERERLYHNLRVVAGRLKSAREVIDEYEKEQNDILDQLDAIERGASPQPASRDADQG